MERPNYSIAGEKYFDPLRGRRGLVDEDQSLGVEVELAVEPGYAAAQDIGTLLL